MVRLILALATLLTLPVLLVGGWVAYGSWQEYAFNRHTPLAAGLYSDWGAMRDEFRHRVRQRFPAGTAADELVADLTAQGV